MRTAASGDRVEIDNTGLRIYGDDDEAAEIWQKDVGLSADRVERMGEHDNFWPAGAPTASPAAGPEPGQPARPPQPMSPTPPPETVPEIDPALVVPAMPGEGKPTRDEVLAEVTGGDPTAGLLAGTVAKAHVP